MTLETWQYILAVLTPVFLAVVNQPKWSPQVKRVVMLVFAVAMCAVTSWLSGQLDFSNMTWQKAIQLLVPFIGTVQVAYVALKANRSTSSALDWLEQITASKSAPATPVVTPSSTTLPAPTDPTQGL